MLKKIPHCTNKVAYFQTHKSNEIILKYIDRKSLEILVKGFNPWGELLGGTYNFINDTKERLKKSLGQNLYFSHFLGLYTPDGDGPETALIVLYTLTVGMYC